MRYSTIFFDLYGTLLDIHTDEESDAAWAALNEALAEVGGAYGTLEELRAAFSKATEAAYSGNEMAASGEETAASGEVEVSNKTVASEDPLFEPDYRVVYERLVKEAAPELEGEELAAAAADAAWAFRQGSELKLQPYEGAAELLAKLRELGCKVVLVSNAQYLYTMPELKQFGLDERFDHVVISSEEGVKKPSPKLFEHAMELAGVSDPKTVLMVGNDEQCDIDGARAAGIDGAFLDTYGHGPYEGAVLNCEGADYHSLLEFIR